MKKYSIKLFLYLIFISININTCFANNIKFKDVSTYNNGRLIIYSVFTPSNNFNEMQNYARKKAGNGESKFVYFFNNLKHTPNISKVGMDFDNKYNKYWVGGYFYYYGNKENFIKYPGRP